MFLEIIYLKNQAVFICLSRRLDIQRKFDIPWKLIATTTKNLMSKEQYFDSNKVVCCLDFFDVLVHTCGDI